MRIDSGVACCGAGTCSTQIVVGQAASAASTATSASHARVISARRS